jgi:hypothetical protein
VHNFDPIAILKHGRAPVVAAHDGEVQFDGDSLNRQLELSDKFGQGNRFGEFSGIAVDVDLQRLLKTSFRRVNDTAQLGRLVLRHCPHENRSAAGSKLRNLRFHCRHAIALGL